MWTHANSSAWAPISEPEEGIGKAMAEVAVAGVMGRKPPPVSVQTCRDQSPGMRWSQLLLCSFPSLSQTRNLHALIPRKHSLLSSFLMVSILRENSSPASPFPAALHSGEEHCSFSQLRWKPLLSLSTRNHWEYFISVELLFRGLWLSHKHRHGEQKSFPE